MKRVLAGIGAVLLIAAVAIPGGLLFGLPWWMLPAVILGFIALMTALVTIYMAAGYAMGDWP